MDPKLKIEPERRTLNGFYFVFVEGSAQDWPEQFYCLRAASTRAEILAQQYPGCTVYVATLSTIGSVEIPRDAIRRTGVMEQKRAA